MIYRCITHISYTVIIYNMCTQSAHYVQYNIYIYLMVVELSWELPETQQVPRLPGVVWHRPQRDWSLATYQWGAWTAQVCSTWFRRSTSGQQYRSWTQFCSKYAGLQAATLLGLRSLSFGWVVLQVVTILIEFLWFFDSSHPGRAEMGGVVSIGIRTTIESPGPKEPDVGNGLLHHSCFCSIRNCKKAAVKLRCCTEPGVDYNDLVVYCALSTLLIPFLS